MKSLKAGLVLALVAAAAIPALAQERQRNEPGAPDRTDAPAGMSTTAAAPERTFGIAGVAVANVGTARVAVVFDAFDQEIERAKGVQYVRKPAGATGLYCVRTSNLSKAATRNLVPQVTVEYYNSVSDDNKGYFAYFSERGCRAREIAVETRRMNDSGFVVATDNVGWSLVAQ